MERYLTAEQIKGLIAQHRNERDRRVADRIKAVVLWHKGWTYKQIAEALMLNEETISEHVYGFKVGNKLKPENGGNYGGKLNREQIDELKEYLTKNTFDTSQRICEYVKEQYGVVYTVAGMTYWLRKNGFSYKQPKGTPAKADIEKQKAFIERYEQIMNEAGHDEPVLFGDSVHPTMATKISRGWIKTGTEKLINTTASRTRVNISGVIDLESMRVITESYETINSESMVKFLSKVKAQYPNAPNIHIILDQASYHISGSVLEFAARNNIKIYHLPPYSPNLNPIERLWKVMNEHVRNNKFFSSPKEFKSALAEFFSTTWDTVSQSMVDRINDNFQTLKSAS